MHRDSNSRSNVRRFRGYQLNHQGDRPRLPKESPRTNDLQRLITDPDLRCQVTNAMSAALPHIPDGTCILDIATDMADVMLSPAAELAPRSVRPARSTGFVRGVGVEAEMNAAWRKREEARRRKGMNTTGKSLRNVREAAALSFLWVFVLKTRVREGDQAGFYKALKDDELGREARPQLGVHHGRRRFTP